ncbi:FAD-dependent oxidoreductase [Trichocoleus sp. FACHB-591]|uniref:response regulator n=1 Tax=unclassified Trichocoleus TaxID=2628910 RepID=UPI001685F370|nr:MULTISPECIES: response regulator [unclassified Trichocoleus]MBD2095546.1 FAD-dependent oxidoreductase [Trichocoleus sp. FACHB-591]MBD2120904.1 FAD-dependent oxidoreductase [Trichocoleus sp. FACHB-262]
MAKPVILTVDDDPDVLQTVSRDLRHQYGDRFRIVRADSGQAALDALQQLKLRNEFVALFLVDQRMPQMSGVEFLEQALDMYPNSKRALLTAYADTDAAIRAINSIQIDYYLLKPWDPPEERLYPVLDDLLDDWFASFRPPFEGIRVVGNRWSPLSHQVKDFLARNQVPYQWLDIELEGEATQLVEYAEADGKQQLPLVLFPDGSRLIQPSNLAIAEKIGLQTQAERPFYDLAIIGGGPAGLAAAVYGASEGLSTVMIERQAPGGQAGSSSRIENYLGFPVGLSGVDLARRAVAQARRFGVEILTPQEVTAVEITNPYRILHLADGSEISCHALLVATGVAYRKLDVPGMDQLCGAGVYYGAAMTEAIACQGETVYIVGGANSAGQAAMHFSKYALEVVMLVRSPLTKSMSQYLIDQIEATNNIKVCVGCAVEEVKGDKNLEAIVIKNIHTGESETVEAASLFIFIGAMPKTDWLDGVVERDERGFILTGPDLIRDGKPPKGWNQDRSPFLLETSVPGIFAAGDARYNSVKRVASGVGEGSIAVQFIHRYLSKV